MAGELEAKETDVRILVTDYDHCAARPDSDREDLLSTPLINRAQHSRNNYKGFYGCTHRSSMTAYFVKYPFHNPSIKKYFSKHPDKFKHLSTTSITRNLEKATKLKCQNVSMLNDIFLSADQCGVTFKKIIQPYEASNRRLRCDFITTLPNVMKAHFGNKNYQLLQIARDAAAKNDSNVTITLDYIDDNLKLCEQAIDAPKQFGAQWPINVKIKSFQHKEKGQIVEVTAASSMQANSCASRVGFFAGATAAVLATGAAVYSLCAKRFSASAA